MEPAVQKSLKKHSEGGSSGKKLPGIDFQFVETDFGSIPPKISNIRTLKVPEDDAHSHQSIVIDFDVEYEGDCNIQVKLMGIPSGVR